MLISQSVTMRRQVTVAQSVEIARGLRATEFVFCLSVPVSALGELREKTKNEFTRKIQEAASAKLFLVYVICCGCNL
jgi:hypothetical protein